MTEYNSKPVTIDRPINEVYSRVSDFSTYQNKLEELPEDVRAKVGDVRFTPDSILINAAPVGEIAFEAVERIEPSRVKLQAKNAPVSMHLILNLKPESDDSTVVVSTIEVDIPTYLRPLVGGKMQEAADKFGELLSTFFGKENA